MSRPLRTLLALCLAAVVVAALAAQPAMAKKNEPCWRTLINDWYDGVIDDRYKLACYREALDKLDGYPDLRNYSSAHDDINRAYLARVAEIRRARNQPKTPPEPNGPDEHAQEVPSVPVTPPPPDDPGSEVATPTPPPPVTDPPSLPRKDETSAPPVTERAPKVVHLPSSQPTSTAVGRDDDDKGPIGNGIKAVGPDTADGVPIPLLVLGGLALVLMLGGALGFVARRMQSRRPPMRPATAPAETRRR